MTKEAKNDLKSAPQGAATTIYATLSKEWEGQGGKYLSNCAVEPPISTNRSQQEGATGHAPWAYDAASASKLWEESNKLVGIKEA